MANRHPYTKKRCLWCKQPFTGGPKALYCSPSCGGFYRRRARGVKPKAGWGKSEESRKMLQPYKDKGLTYQGAVRAWLADYKLKRGCTDCGFNRHPAALELDHEGEKSIEIAKARTSIDRLLEEIEKGECVVRCSNCHAIKTAERRQNGKDEIAA